LALNREGDAYSVQADLYNGQVEQYVGKNAGLLTQRYAAEKARIEAFKHSLAVTEENEGSNIVLTLIDTDTGGQIKVVCHVGGDIVWKALSVQWNHSPLLWKCMKKNL